MSGGNLGPVFIHMYLSFLLGGVTTTLTHSQHEHNSDDHTKTTKHKTHTVTMTSMPRRHKSTSNTKPRIMESSQTLVIDQTQTISSPLKSPKSRRPSTGNRRPRRHHSSGRKPRKAVSTTAILDRHLIDKLNQSESSLNPLEDIPNNSLTSMNTSQGSMLSQPHNSFQSTNSDDRKHKQKMTRISNLRREMSEQLNRSASSTSSASRKNNTTTVPLHIQLSSSPAPPPTRHKRNSPKVLSIKSSNDPSPMPPKTKPLRNSMRNLLRNNHHHHLSLDRFLIMKKQSESLAMDTQHAIPRLVEDLEDSNASFGEELPLSIDDQDDHSDISETSLESNGDHLGSKIHSTTRVQSMVSQTLSLSLCDDPDWSVEEEGEDSVAEETHRVHHWSLIDVASGCPAVYSGHLSKRTGLPHGKGRLELLNSHSSSFYKIIEAYFCNGLAMGRGRSEEVSGRESDDSLDVIYEGYFRHSLRHGPGTLCYANGQSFDGIFHEDVKQHGTLTYLDGSSYTGGWKNNLRDGPKGRYQFANGSIYVGDFLEDQMEGEGVLTHPNGNRFVGAWKKGGRHGHGFEFRPDGTLRREGRWIKGVFQKTETSN